MRKLTFYTGKYGATEGSRFYYRLQRLAAAGSAVERQRDRMRRQGLPVPPKPPRP